MLIAVLYSYNGDAATMDAERPAHRAYLDSHPGLRLSGPTAAGGAVIIIEADSAPALEQWLDDDPFWKAGVIAQRTVTPWNPVMGTWRELLGV